VCFEHPILTLETPEETGTITPSGEKVLEINEPFTVSMKCESDYYFVEWAAYVVSGETEELTTEALVFTDIVTGTDNASSSATATLKQRRSDIVIRPTIKKRPVITLEAQNNTGTLTPSGTRIVNLNTTLNLNMACSEKYTFVRWAAYIKDSATGLETETTTAVSFTDTITSKDLLTSSTVLTLLEERSDIVIRPITFLRPSVTFETMPNSGVITGDVRDEKVRLTHPKYLPVVSGSKDEWTPINGAKVYLCKTDFTPVQEYTVDTCYNGVFVFWNVEPGNYKLRYTANEYIGDTVDVTVTAGKITTKNAKLVNENYVPPVPPRIDPGDYPIPNQEAGAVVPTEFVMESVSNNQTPFVNTLNIRRSIIKGGKMYILTEDSKLFIADAVTGDSIAQMNTAVVTGGDKPLSDIAFTSDSILMGCNLSLISLPAQAGQAFKVYKWANDSASAELLFTSVANGNWSNGNVGTTMVISGPSWKFKLYTTATTTGSSRQVRIIGLEYDLNEQMVTLSKYMMSTTEYTEALWGADMRFTISPREPNSFVVDSKILMPTEYQFDWEAADRSPLINKGVMSETLLPKVAYGATYFRYAGHALMSAPVCDAASANVGVILFDITDGFNNAVAVTQKMPSTGLGTEVANHMVAASVVDGYDITTTIFAQNEGLARFKTSTDNPINIFAYDLRYEKKSETTHQFSFILNENATNVEIQFLKDNVVIGSKVVGALAKGAQTVDLVVADLPNEDGMTFAVKATAPSPIRVSKFSDPANPATQFYNSYGLAIDNNTENSTFARLYISNAKAGTCEGGRYTGTGIYISDPLLGDPTAQGNTVYAGGITWAASNSPYRISVAEDGRLFIADWSDTHSGVYIMNANNPSANFKTLFEGCTRAASGLLTNASNVPVGGSSPCLWVKGKGENTQLYVFDEDYVAPGG
ncbi:MAG TPA: hypothetical protein PLK45_01495, partial [Paludibacteraceae bacterium]|nr:hypothetical protein [Paludibacteraceae bacterium]